MSTEEVTEVNLERPTHARVYDQTNVGDHASIIQGNVYNYGSAADRLEKKRTGLLKLLRLPSIVNKAQHFVAC